MRWTDDELEILKSNLPIAELVELLPYHSYKAILKKSIKIGSRERTKGHTLWTDEEDEKLKKHGSVMLSTELINLITNHTIRSIESRCNKLGIYKTDECRSRLGRIARSFMTDDDLYKLDQTIKMEDLDNSTFQTLVGSMLGDGGVTKSECNKSYHFSEGHGWRQKEYVKWKMNFLSIFKPIYSDSCNPHITTPSHKIFNYLREWFYVGGMKLDKNTISLEIIKRFDLFGLLIWFLDDGYLGRPKSGLRASGHARRTYPTISAKGYNYDNLVDVCDLLNNNLGLHLFVKSHKHKDGMNKLVCLNKDKNYLFPIWQAMAIECKLPDCMFYKLNMCSGNWIEEKVK